MQQNSPNFGGLLTVPKPNRATALDFLSSPLNDFDDDFTHFSPYPQHEQSAGASADIRSPFSNFGGKGLGVSESTTPEVLDEVQGRINNALGIPKSQTWVGLDLMSTKPDDHLANTVIGSNIGWKSTPDLQAFEGGFSFAGKALSRISSAMPEQVDHSPRSDANANNISRSSLSASGFNGLLPGNRQQQQSSVDLMSYHSAQHSVQSSFISSSDRRSQSPLALPPSLQQQAQSTQEDSAWPKPMRYNHFNSFANDDNNHRYHQQQGLAPLTPHAAREVNNNSTGPVIRPPSSQNNSSNNLTVTGRASQQQLMLPSFGGQQQLSEEILMIQKTFSPPPPSTGTAANNTTGYNKFISPHTYSNTATSSSSTAASAAASAAAKTGIGALDERAIENVIANNCQQILMDAAEHMLKAVELANTLRARVGTEVLALVRERWGGLLSLLERHPDRFVVERIAKNDRVLLVDPRRSTATVSDGSDGKVDSSSGSSNMNHHVSSENHTNNTHQSSSALVNSHNSSHSQSYSHQHIHDPYTHSSMLEGNQTASRCLHVGNVPTNYTEVQLMREFEKFGQLDGLKLINQKNGQRRFAFITFKTVEQAITARHCMSKLHPWKSAISFAHKELVASSAALPAPHMQQQQSARSAVSPSSMTRGNAIKEEQLQQQLQVQVQQQVQQLQLQQQFQSLPQAAAVHAHPGKAAEQATASSAVRRLDPNARTFVSEQEMRKDFHAYFSSSAHNHFMHHPHQQHQQQQVFFDQHDPRRAVPQRGLPMTAATPSFLGGIEATGSGIDGRESAILLRLCDDTYVPTQPWPIDLEADLTFCRSITEQITQFGGSTTISKLRGFLKHRIGTTDNIKSVPLKALLLAYSSVFRVERNFVSLVSTATSAASSTST